ncbi:MAG: anthranilate synthase component I family protein [Mariprofundaceae bacterium]
MRIKGSVPFIRRFLWADQTPSAHDLLQAYPDKFSALLEDPAGSGRQILVSRAGESRSLSDLTESESFFKTWKDDVSSANHDSAGIRCLIYAAYEAGGLIESLPNAKTQAPVTQLWLHYPAWSLVFDQAQKYCELCASSEDQLDHLESLLQSLKQYVQPNQPMTVSAPQSSDPEAYKQAVEKVREYICAGDVFQVNIARFWQTPLQEKNVFELYACLRDVNPAPFSCFVRVETDHDNMFVISSSPERLFQLHANGVLETRPIAGTRKRGDHLNDDALRDELLLSEKECAEHIMLVDLERNDLGRVCEPGSVVVNEKMKVERYPTVQHIVSNVRGKLSDKCDVVDVFKAMFPGGTITGCPKVRCMEIIHELEQQARGPYTGGIGYIAWDGSADMNILIRTFWHHQGKLNWAAGAGIVADSDPDAELEETTHKAAGLLRALKIL